MSLTLASGVEHQRRRVALVGCGLDPDLPMARGDSNANEVWLGRELVLRVNWRGVGRLAREASIAARIPRDVRYPEVLVVGDDGEVEWMLARRRPGIDLGRAWVTMTALQRERAIHELAGALAALHGTPTDGIPDDIRPPHTLPLAPLLELIDETIRSREPEIADAATAFVTDRWGAFDDVGRGLAHGDPHFENVLWDGEHVSAVLDLEWSRPSWVCADLEILLAVATWPALFASADHEHMVVAAHYRDVPRWLRAAQPTWFDHPRLTERLAILLLSRTLGCLADAPETEFRWEHVAATLGGESLLRW